MKIEEYEEARNELIRAISKAREITDALNDTESKDRTEFIFREFMLDRNRTFIEAGEDILNRNERDTEKIYTLVCDYLQATAMAMQFCGYVKRT
jgi:hypothetical protein